MYNYSFYCTYLDMSSNEHQQDTVYRQEILKAFNLMVYDHEKMKYTTSERSLKNRIQIEYIYILTLKVVFT